MNLEVPVDLFAEPASECTELPPASVNKPAPPATVIDQVAKLLNNAKTPLILVGGGASHASDAIKTFAETINAPVVMTTNARGVLAPDHPLAISASPSLIAVRQLTAAADVVLALGTEFGSTDYDMYERGGFRVDNTLIRVDIDSRQLHNGDTADVPVLADSEQFLHMLQPQLESRKDETALTRAAETRDAAWQELDDDMQQDCKVLDLLRQHFPTQPFIGDSTQLTYAGNLYGGASGPHRWFNSATGFGALGYGVPVAIGAAIAVAMGLDATLVDSKEAFEAALIKAKSTGKATLIEIDEQIARSMVL